VILNALTSQEIMFPNVVVSAERATVMVKKQGESNSKNGNKYLAWAFVEAANFAIHHNKIVKSYYQRKAAKTDQIITIKTVAHKLARSCFYVLRD
jgi:transposase